MFDNYAYQNWIWEQENPDEKRTWAGRRFKRDPLPVIDPSQDADNIRTLRMTHEEKNEANFKHLEKFGIK